MKQIRKAIAIAVAVLCTSATTLSASMFGENFNYGTLDTNLTVSHDPGFSFAISGDRAVVRKQANVGNGAVRITTTFKARGDFSATVRAGRVSIGATSGMGIFTTLGNIFFRGQNGDIRANVGSRGYLAAVSASSASFRIRRVADTLFLQYDVGSGFQTLHSYTSTAVGTNLVEVGLFLTEENTNPTSASGWFDDFEMTADSFAPEVRSRLVAEVEVAAFLISWPSLTNRHYQLEHRSTLTTNAWVALGERMVGTGWPMSFTNWAAGQPQSYYRVVESP